MNYECEYFFFSYFYNCRLNFCSDHKETFLPLANFTFFELVV